MKEIKAVDYNLALELLLFCNTSGLSKDKATEFFSQKKFSQRYKNYIYKLADRLELFTAELY
jgi:hypothetical protein